MSEQEVIDLMKSSKTEDEWNRNCDEVKRRCGGYPGFWYGAIVLSGILSAAVKRFEADDLAEREG